MTSFPHDIVRYSVLFVVAFFAGAINSVAGGGTLLTFPTLLLAGVSPIVANATNTLALVPGSIGGMWGYREDIKQSKREMLLLGLPSIIGGVIGAVLVVHAGNRLFAKMVPWLIFGATALFIGQEPVSRLMNKRLPASETASDEAPQGIAQRTSIAVFQFFVAIYGGFFGAGIGILMLAALGFMGFASNIHRANGIKNFAAACINGVATIAFIVMRRINWPFALLMAVAAVLGGYNGAGLARRLGQKKVRNLIACIGIGIGVYMLVRPV